MPRPTVSSDIKTIRTRFVDGMKRRLLDRVEEDTRLAVDALDAVAETSRSTSDITPAQHGYLSALDQYLRARTEEDESTAVLAMSVMADLIRTESGLVPRENRHGPHQPRRS